MKLRMPDYKQVFTEKEELDFTNSDVSGDVKLSLDLSCCSLKVKITSDTTPMTYIMLRWNFTDDEKRTDSVKVLGDAWERGYGNLGWLPILPTRIMPWYCLVSNGSDLNPDNSGRFTEGFGVGVQPGAIVTWQYDGAGITMWADIRCGGDGVLPAGRYIDVCDVLFREYRDMSAFEAGKQFCSAMSPSPVLPKHKVYGSNNWYYAYGHSSHEEILGDTEIVASQCEGLDNIPYMVIDDGWQKNSCDAPWTETNERFPDMARLAKEMKERGVRPGLWIRYLIDSKFEVFPEDSPLRHPRFKIILDPSRPEVIDYVKKLTKMIVNDWGFTLIKHDYSFADVFGDYGFACHDRVTANGWHFWDRTRTSAEITKDFYKAVKDAAGEDTVIIGCNTISHLCAGMYELNRTGDDTSGREWERTRYYGVNTLAFRLIQNGSFYMCDADCVGIMGRFPWKLNRQWLDVLAKSGSPLFVSCKPGVLDSDGIADLKEGWAINSVQANSARPLDWMENECPAVWEIDGEIVKYNWYYETGIGNFRP